MTEMTFEWLICRLIETQSAGQDEIEKLEALSNAAEKAGYRAFFGADTRRSNRSANFRFAHPQKGEVAVIYYSWDEAFCGFSLIAKGGAAEAGMRSRTGTNYLHTKEKEEARTLIEAAINLI